ncbi:hypothetical protein HK100_001816 [Physocladia obscura]|uniref:Major facilitator superfamily (MFS) profile domain-containing protein n=1 Tax=Physocladia obscura TaxID=109957 RepID=A0AAD5XAS4_9FUNG|nr:hypothetical protein HK100_001816 [Physocladia obscura]
MELSSFTDEITPKDPTSLATFESLSNYAGMMAAVFMPFCYDWKGRKFGFLIGNIIAFIGSAISVFGSLNPTNDTAANVYYFGRFIAVLGIDISAGCSWMYANELAHPAHRAYFGGLFGIAWSIGSFIDSLIWRFPTIMQMVFSVLIIITLPFIPESPRTLVSKGREEEAEKVVREWVGCSIASEQFVQEQMAELRESLAGGPKNESIFEVYNMSPLWSTKNASRRIFIMIITNAVINLLNVGTTGGIFATLIYEQIGLGSDRQKTAINLGNTFLSIIVGCIASLYMDIWGRRRTYMIGYGISFVLGFIGAIAMEGFRDTSLSGYSYLYIFSVFLGTIYSTPLSCVKLLFEAELMAYSYRAKGKALSDFTLKPSNVILTYMQSAVYSAIDTRSFWVAQGYVLIFWGLHWFIMPETRGRTLEEVDEIFDHPSPMYTEWFHKNSGEVNYVKHSLNLLKEKEIESGDPLPVKA